MSRRAVVLQICALSGGCASTAARDIETGSVVVDGGAIAFKRRAGRGPTIVFESGLGDGLESWDPIVPLLPADVAFFAYSRPGYGESAVAPIQNGTRSADEAARRLRRVLNAARVRAPHVLVGHSLGGMYITRYAELFPDTVSGLVFVDARPSGFFGRCQREGASCGIRAQRPPDWPAHILAEAEGIPEAEAHGVSAALIGGIPATVITSTRPMPGDEGARIRRLWIAEERVLAEAFRDHRFVEADTGHYVHHDDPALVVREIVGRASH